jgi:hypothetical protein
MLGDAADLTSGDEVAFLETSDAIAGAAAVYRYGRVVRLQGAGSVVVEDSPATSRAFPTQRIFRLHGARPGQRLFSFWF